MQDIFPPLYLVMAISLLSTKICFIQLPPSSSSSYKTRPFKPAHCIPLQQTQELEQTIQMDTDLTTTLGSQAKDLAQLSDSVPEDAGIICQACSDRGWVVCDFCNGQKTNVKAQNNRVYRRCPTCRAVGCVLCSKCKVFKCVTFPDYNDG